MANTEKLSSQEAFALLIDWIELHSDHPLCPASPWVLSGIQGLASVAGYGVVAPTSTMDRTALRVLCNRLDRRQLLPYTQ